MAIDFYGTFPCKVRNALPDAELLRLEKSRNRAHQVLELMRKNPNVDKTLPESEWQFKAVTLGPNGPQEVQLRIGDLLAEAEPLQALAQHCINCPANVRAGDFGCGGAVHYPISAQAERWLLAQLPDNLKSARGELLLRAMADFQFNGADIDTARSRPDLYELKQPVERKWGGLLSKKTRLTSSQILHMVFGVGSLQPAHAKLVAYFLGFLNDDFSINHGSAVKPTPGDDASIAEMKLFLSVAALAGTSGVSVLVDA